MAGCAALHLPYGCWVRLSAYPEIGRATPAMSNTRSAKGDGFRSAQPILPLDEQREGPPLAERPSSGDPRVKPGDGDDGLRLCRHPSAVPAELLRLAGGALAKLDVDQPRAGRVHQLVER